MGNFLSGPIIHVGYDRNFEQVDFSTGAGSLVTVPSMLSRAVLPYVRGRIGAFLKSVL